MCFEKKIFLIYPKYIKNISKKKVKMEGMEVTPQFFYELFIYFGMTALLNRFSFYVDDDSSYELEVD